MKIFNYAFLFILPCFAITANAQQENETHITPVIKTVTVFLNGAEIKHSESVSLKKGTNKIVFDKLSAYMELSSVQASVEGDADIQSVSTESNYLSAEKLDPRIKDLKDSIDMLNTEITDINSELDANSTEKYMLTVNENVGGKQTPSSLLELDKAADYFHKKTLEINNNTAKLNKEKTMLTEQLTLMNSQLSALNYKNNTERKEIIVVINSAASGHVTVNLRYLVSNTGWEPSYDLVANDITQPITLKYKARVYNNTGIDWKNVALTFSTADPTVSASRPYLSTWSLNQTSRMGDYEELEKAENADSIKVSYDGQKNQVTLDNSVRYKSITVSEQSTSINIITPYSIPSDAKPYTVDITSYTLNATYGYVTIPKLDNSAFLVAKISGWEKLYLIDGPMNVYFNNAYIGASVLSTQRVEDTLELSLGRDNQIQIARQKKEDFGSKALIGSSRKQTFKYEITVKNNKTTPVKIEVQDQVPISQESDITVDVENISGAQFDNVTGRLKWLASLKPGETITYTIAFTVKYPKGKELHLKEYHYRVVNCPSF